MGHLTVLTGKMAGNLTKIFQKSQMPRGGGGWAVLELTGTLFRVKYYLNPATSIYLWVEVTTMPCLVVQMTGESQKSMCITKLLAVP